VRVVYSPEGMSAEVERHGVNLVVVPSVCPETFCDVVEDLRCCRRDDELRASACGI
jgi:hypothetical protein